MKPSILLVLVLSLFIALGLSNQSKADETNRRLFFLHHSTGRYLLEEGNARQHLNDHNNELDLNLVLWDHDYNYIGLSDQQGDLLGYNYSIPDDNTYPDGLHQLWTTNNSARDSLLARYDIIAFKSCYPASDIESETQLNQYKQWYLEMRSFFDTRPDKVFIIMSPPPRHRLETNVANADRARRFSQWLTGEDFLSGHDNLVGFDYFDLLAQPDDQSTTRNMLRFEYERSHSQSDSHPNALANITNAPIFIDLMVLASLPSTSSSQGTPSLIIQHHNYPNPFNPNTIISFNLNQSAFVQVQVFDIQGNRIRTLLNDNLRPGPQSIFWDGCDEKHRAMSSGVYLYSLKTTHSIATGKMVLAR